MAKKVVKRAKKKKAGEPSDAAMKRARVIVRRALEDPNAKDEDPLSKFGFPNAPSRAALAQRLNNLGVAINPGPVVVCTKVGCVVTAVARVNG